MPQIQIPGWRCCRCGHIWISRDWGFNDNGKKPVTCPKCRSAYWDIPRVKDKGIQLLTYKCKLCKHKWVARTELPERCPKCHSISWNNDTLGVKGRPKGSKTKKPDAYAGRTERVKQEYGGSAYHEWGKKGGNPLLLGNNETVVINCIHHWILNRENFGRCKKCGVEKQFTPSTPLLVDKS